MTAASFRSYVEQQFNSDFAKFVCDELLFLTPDAFGTDITWEEIRTYINRCGSTIDQSSKSLFYVAADDMKFEIKMPVLKLIERLRLDCTAQRKKAGTW